MRIQIKGPGGRVVFNTDLIRRVIEHADGAVTVFSGDEGYTLHREQAKAFMHAYINDAMKKSELIDASAEWDRLQKALQGAKAFESAPAQAAQIGA